MFLLAHAGQHPQQMLFHWNVKARTYGAWWVVLPINYNALYEVHLFAVFPLLLAILVILWEPGPLRKRRRHRHFPPHRNPDEAGIPGDAMLFRLGSFGWDLVQMCRGKLSRGLLAAAHGLPLAAASAVVWFYFSHSLTRQFFAELREKNAFNVCQIFAFGYQQRSADFQGSPWRDYQPLMTRIFGSPNVTIREALVRNPLAMMGHFWWNLRLALAAIQVALLNVRWGGVNPDYIATFQSSLVWIPTAIASGPA